VKPTHVDLFSGIGGFALAARWAGFRTIAFCEIDKYCQRVLRQHFNAPICSDIFAFDGTAYRGCDLITGGFPCQPFSVAGKRRGAADDRAIWPEMLRVINEARPAWVLGENVPGIITMELDNVLSDLEGIGYACRSFVIPACAVDAKHRRDRLWIVCRDISDSNSNQYSFRRTSEKWQQSQQPCRSDL
jgi:DNA (cytosine-5)-methyltransferase 1